MQDFTQDNSAVNPFDESRPTAHGNTRVAEALRGPKQPGVTTELGEHVEHAQQLNVRLERILGRLENTVTRVYGPEPCEAPDEAIEKPGGAINLLRYLNNIGHGCCSRIETMLDRLDQFV